MTELVDLDGRKPGFFGVFLGQPADVPFVDDDGPIFSWEKICLRVLIRLEEVRDVFDERERANGALRLGRREDLLFVERLREDDPPHRDRPLFEADVPTFEGDAFRHPHPVVAEDGEEKLVPWVGDDREELLFLLQRVEMIDMIVRRGTEVLEDPLGQEVRIPLAEELHVSPDRRNDVAHTPTGRLVQLLVEAVQIIVRQILHVVAAEVRLDVVLVERRARVDGRRLQLFLKRGEKEIREVFAQDFGLLGLAFHLEAPPELGFLLQGLSPGLESLLRLGVAIKPDPLAAIVDLDNPQGLARPVVFDFKNAH